MISQQVQTESNKRFSSQEEKNVSSGCPLLHDLLINEMGKKLKGNLDPHN
jgi:hypothetical protein